MCTLFFLPFDAVVQQRGSDPGILRQGPFLCRYNSWDSQPIYCRFQEASAEAHASLVSSLFPLLVPSLVPFAVVLLYLDFRLISLLLPGCHFLPPLCSMGCIFCHLMPICVTPKDLWELDGTCKGKKDTEKPAVCKHFLLFPNHL